MGGDQFDSGRGLASLETTFSELVGYAEVLQEDAVETADALEAMMDSLALVPGRKALFLVSDGFAMRPFDRLATNLQRRILGVRVTQGGELMARSPTDGPSGFDDDANIITASSNAASFAKSGRPSPVRELWTPCGRHPIPLPRSCATRATREPLDVADTRRGSWTGGGRVL